MNDRNEPENPLRRLDDWEHFVEDSEAVINHDLLANQAGERNPKDGKGAKMLKHRIRVNGLNLGWMDSPAEHTVQKRFHAASDDWLRKAEQEAAVRSSAQARRGGGIRRLPPLGEVGADDRFDHRL